MIYSVTALAAPHNGTTAYLVREAIIKDVNATAEERAVVAMLTVATAPHLDRALSDSAEYDMDIDHALAINENISTLKNVYYFSYPCSATERNADGTYSPVDGNIDRLFRACAVRMGKFTCTTKGGYVVDESGSRTTDSSTKSPLSLRSMRPLPFTAAAKSQRASGTSCRHSAATTSR